MALLDNPSAAHTMYSNMMTSSYLLHHHQQQQQQQNGGPVNNTTPNRINPDWAAAAAVAATHNGSPTSGGLSPIIEDVRVARVAPSQRLSSGSSGSGSNPESSPPAPTATHINSTGFKPYASSSPEEKNVSKVFGSKADLQLHTQIHMREAKPYKCSQCSKSFANSSYLSQHTRIHLGIKPYRCEICQRKFTQLSHLQQHIRTHTGDKPYKCRHPGCTKAFSQLSNLQSHSRCHQTDKPYKCNSCYKCFVDETALLEHIPKHKESKHLKTHICQYCGKSYTQETYLAKHMQKHSDRPDKRPPIVGQGLPGAPGTAVSGANASAAAAASAAAVAAAHHADYWPKMDPVYGHDRVVADYQSAAGLVDPRLNAHHRDMDDQRHHMDEMRHQTGNGQVGGYGAVSAAADVVKTSSSAFSPIQGAAAGMLNSTMNSRNYFYEPLAFPRNNSHQVGFNSRPGGAAFPNQLISLSDIRNYGQSDLLHTLRERAGQVTQ